MNIQTQQPYKFGTVAERLAVIRATGKEMNERKEFHELRWRRELADAVAKKCGGRGDLAGFIYRYLSALDPKALEEIRVACVGKEANERLRAMHSKKHGKRKEQDADVPADDARKPSKPRGPHEGPQVTRERLMPILGAAATRLAEAGEKITFDLIAEEAAPEAGMDSRKLREYMLKNLGGIPDLVVLKMRNPDGTPYRHPAPGHVLAKVG